MCKVMGLEQLCVGWCNKVKDNIVELASEFLTEMQFQGSWRLLGADGHNTTKAAQPTER